MYMMHTLLCIIYDKTSAMHVCIVKYALCATHPTHSILYIVMYNQKLHCIPCTVFYILYPTNYILCIWCIVFDAFAFGALYCMHHILCIVICSSHVEIVIWG